MELLKINFLLLNSNQAITITNVKTSILKTKITLLKAGNIVVISYTGDTIDNVKQGDLQVIGTIPPDYVPRQRIVIAPIQVFLSNMRTPVCNRDMSDPFLLL